MPMHQTGKTAAAPIVALAAFPAGDRNVGQEKSMTVAEAISLIDALAWPTVVIILAALFRKVIFGKIGDLTRLEARDIKLDFERQVADVVRKAEELPVAKGSDATQGLKPTISERTAEIAKVSPNASIVMAWGEVEEALSQAVYRLGPPIDYPHLARPPSLPNRSDPSSCLSYLSDEGLISHQTVDIVRDLRQLRNRAAHTVREHVVTVAEARRYGQAAERLVSLLDGLQEKETVQQSSRHVPK